MNKAKRMLDYLWFGLFGFFIVGNFIVGTALIINQLWMQGIVNIILGIFLIIYVKFRILEDSNEKGSGNNGEKHR